MKRMLLSVLLLAASAIMVQAQGFRVYRSDGAVYEFNVVADSIVFFDGAGDPDYQEPIPDYVRRAIEELQTYCANNAMMINQLLADVMNNTNAINQVQAENANRLNDLNATLSASIAAIQKEVGMNSTSIARLQDMLEALAARAYDIQNVATMIEAKLAQQEGTIKKIQDDVAVVKAASAELNAHLADIQNDLANVQNQVYNNTNRISSLEASVTVNRNIINMLENEIAQLKDKIVLLEQKDEEKDAQLEDLFDRLQYLEEQINQ